MEEETTLAEIAQQLACLAAVLREMADKPLFDPVANNDKPAQDELIAVAVTCLSVVHTKKARWEASLDII